MLDPPDIGGLGWSESTALTLQRVVGWFVLVAGCAVLWRPFVVVLGLLALSQFLITVAMWLIADGYSLQATWAPSHLLTLFPFATQLARIVAPLGLLLLSFARQGQSTLDKQASLTMQALRWCIAVVFLAHGIESWQQNPQFLDLLINSTRVVFGVSLSQSIAEHCMMAIGGFDIAIAIASVSLRWRAVMWWMTFWGGATAFSRIVANGWDTSWHETLTRAPHFGIPLAVSLWWHLLKCQHAAASSAEMRQNTKSGSATIVETT